MISRGFTTRTAATRRNCICSSRNTIRNRRRSVLPYTPEERERMRGGTSFLKIFTIYSALMWATFSAPISSADGSDIIQLISHVHNYFETSCVFVVYTKTAGMNESHVIGNILRKFSARGVLAIAVEFIRLNETVRFYAKRVVRALVVVSLQSRKVLSEFSTMTTDFDMALPCWLLIIDDQVFLDYFSPQPSDNVFHLSFDTQLLVARTHCSTVQEWYWINDKLKTKDLAEWNFGSDFTLRTNKSLYQRRTDLENSRIVVTVFHNPPMISFVNDTIGGLFGTVLSALSTQANFKMEFVLPKEFSYGSWNADENKWTGMMEMLTNGRATVAAADFTITSTRLNSVDFSLPLISTREKLYIRQPSSGIHWSAYWQALTPGIWILIELIIISTVALLTLITAVRGRRITLDAITGYLLFVMGIYCQQGLPEFPVDLPSRITYFSIFISSLVISAAYSAALISYLTVTSTALPFSTLEGFVEDKTYELIVFRDGADYDMFSTATEPTMARMWSKMRVRALLPVTLMNGFKQVCDGKAAFYVPAALQEIVSIHLPCKVVGIDTKRSMSLALALSKGNPYNGLINYHVQRFRDHGILNRLKGIYAVSKDSLTVSAHSEVTVWGVMPVLAILTGGLFLAVIIFCLERKIFPPKSGVGYKRRRIRGSGNGLGGGKEVVNIRLRDRTVKHFPPAPVPPVFRH